jgi:hypothetical protein
MEALWTAVLLHIDLAVRLGLIDLVALNGLRVRLPREVAEGDDGPNYCPDRQHQ